MFVGYARVSTLDQNPALQIDALKATGCERIFEEQASGAKSDRPELASALAYMREGDQLVVWKLDRLARSLRQLVETVEDLRGRGIGFRSLTESIDANTSGGRLTFHLFASIAEFERDLIRERTRAGLKAAKARGRNGGRPKLLTLDDAAAARAMLRDPVVNARAVAKRFQVSVTTLYRYTGSRTELLGL